MRYKNTANGFRYHPDSKTLLYRLIGEVQWLPLLKNKPYQKLIDYIELLAHQKDEDSDQPITIKQIKEEINDNRVAKWLTQMVDDLIDLNWDHPELFKKDGNDYLYQLYFKDSFGVDRLNFSLWLNKPLQVYDLFTWHFAETKISFSNFWVTKISHDFEDGILTTTAELINGWPNRHFEILKDKAEFEGDITSYEMLKMSYVEIEREIKRINKIFGYY